MKRQRTSRSAVKRYVVNAATRAGVNYVRRRLFRSPMYNPRGGRVMLRKKAIRTRPKDYGGRLNPRMVKKKLRKMCAFIKQQEATHIHRQRNTGTLRAVGVARANMTQSFGGTLSQIEAAAANLRFYNPATNGLITQSVMDGTYHRDVKVSIRRTLLVKNNYKVPVEVEVYSCTPKKDTTVDPLTFYANGLVDQGNPSATACLTRFTDSAELKEMYTLKRKIKNVIFPGNYKTVYANTPSFNYEISTNDTHNQAYQKSQGGHAWLVKICGVLGHDSVAANEQGLVSSGIDWLFDTEYCFKYDAGKDLHDITLSDDSTSAFTNAGIVSAKPHVTNQTYLVGAG